MLAKACSPSILVGMRQSTRHHKAAGSMPRSRCISASVVTAMHASLSMLAGVPMVIQEREPVAAIILVAADATTAVRTRVRALVC